MTIYSPENKEVFNEITNVSKAIEVRTPTVVEMIKSYGQLRFEAYIKIWLINLNEFLQLRNPMTESQIDFIATAISEDFRQTSIADINVIFRNAKKGIYGEFYERLSAPKVLGWFRTYYEERIEICAEISRNNHDSLMADSRKEHARSKQAQHIKEAGFKEFRHSENLKNYKNQQK